MITLTKVTWYSQLVAIALSVFIFAVGFYFGTQFGEIDHAATSQTPVQAEDLNTKDQEAPITEDTVKQGSFTGRYELHEKLNVEGDTEMCNTFVVTTGDSALIEYFKQMVLSGNSVQSLTPEGKLRINLPWDSIPANSKEQIKSGAPITLKLIKIKQEPRGAGACESFFAYAGTDD